MPRIYPLLLLFLIFPLQLIAFQKSEIRAQVIDHDSEQPISYATIRFKNTNQGLIANEDGGFLLPKEYIGDDFVLVVSSIGYGTAEIKTTDLSFEGVNLITLFSQIEILDAVVLNSKQRDPSEESSDDLSATLIVRNALSKIKYNYPGEAHSYISYYRDYQRVHNDYYNLNEGIIETFDEGLKWPESNSSSISSALYSFDLNKKYFIDSTLLTSSYASNKQISGNGDVDIGNKSNNELQLLNVHNPIRNFDISSFSFIYELQKDFIDGHEFHLDQVVYENNEALYEISFNSISEVSGKYTGMGTIYISKETFAIHRLDYGAYLGVIAPKGNSTFPRTSYGSGNTVKMKAKGMTIFEVSISYTKIDGRMYPAYITFNNRFEVYGNNALEVKSITFDRNIKAFKFVFNKPLDPKTILKKSNYRLRYNQTKLIVKEIIPIDDYTIKVPVIWSLNAMEQMQFDPESFEFKLRRIKDKSGGEINKRRRIIGYQYRELFTQEIFLNKSKDASLKFVDPNIKLLYSPVNAGRLEKDRYWVNSPLKSNY